MKNMTLANIAKAVDGALHCTPEEERITIQGAVLDSRLVEEGYLFFATKGERVDGHSFIGSVYEKGAVCVICEKETPEVLSAEKPYILVKDSFEALKKTAMFYRDQLSVPIVGVTGSVGKTSTKEFIAGVLSEKYQVLKTMGNFNNEVGLPLTLLRIREEHEAAVVEMGISNFGEMHRLSEIAKPNICVMTNIGQCHLENLISREGVLKAKSEIFDFMQEDGIVILNQEDDMLNTLKEIKGKAPRKYGLDKTDDCYMTEVSDNGILGSSAVFHLGEAVFPVTVKIPGLHMLYNAMAAALVGDRLGLSTKQIQEGISKVVPVDGRSHLIECEDKWILDDCYNANPVSMKAAIDLLKTAKGRKVALLGDMFELGEKEAKLHEEVGRYAAWAGIDVIVCVGKLAKNLYDGAVLACEEMDGSVNTQLYYFADKDGLFENLSGEENFVMPGDTILVKASHGMGFAQVVEELKKQK